MNPLVTVALLAGSAAVAKKVLSKPRRKTSRPPKGPDPVKLGLCGAKWYHGFAIQHPKMYPAGYEGPWAHAATDTYAVFDGYGNLRFNDEMVTDFAYEDGAIDVNLYVIDNYPELVEGKPHWKFVYPHWTWWQLGAEAPKGKLLRVWGNGFLPPEVEQEFCTNVATNKIWANPDCTMIVEGAFFEPLTLGLPLTAIEADTLAGTLAADPENSVYGYIDYLMDTRGLQDTWEIVDAIARNVGLECVNAPPGSLAHAWQQSLASRIAEYVEDNGGIPFSPG